MTRMPSEVTVDSNNMTVVPSDDPAEQAFYDSNVMRLQVRDLNLDWCDDSERKISWSFPPDS